MAKAKRNVTIFKSIYRQEHFTLDDVQYKFTDYTFSIEDCPDELKDKLLAKPTITLSK